MTKALAYAAPAAKSELAPFTFERRNPRTTDVVIEIKYCGICHSDIHQARAEWGKGIFPMVPGHEIAGVVKSVGGKVKKFSVGDHVGVGCFVDSCRECSECKAGDEQFCRHGMSATYNGHERDGTPTYGGYSDHIVVDENYVLRIPKRLPLDGSAPLLCAGITLYSPLRHWHAGPGKKVGIIGLGGLGHMGVKLAHAMGSDVTVFSRSKGKEADAKRLGANRFVATSEQGALTALAGQFDLLISTVSASLDWSAYIGLLRANGTLVIVGVPDQPVQIPAFVLIQGRRSLGGSLIGGIRETQEMLDFCGKHGIASDIELIPIQKVNEAYDRVVKSDVRYRFVIDIASLAGGQKATKNAKNDKNVAKND